jgi:broad specificity phosphatase PhoE
MRLSPSTRALVALLLVAAPLRALAAQASTTVIVVRHAEKAAEPAADPALTATGSARANALLDLVRDAGVQAVITTQFQRTRLTAAPVASALGLTTEIVDARAPQHAKAVADSVLMKHRGQTVLVVGHSNTVPDIVAALGAPRPAAICDDGYDNAYIVTVPASGTASVARIHYGMKASCP